MMDECCAPQWTDFTSSPQLPSDSYFEIEHEVHEPQAHFKLGKTNVSLSCKVGKVTEPVSTDVESQNNSTVVKSTPVKVAYFVPYNNKPQTPREGTNDEVLHVQDAFKNLKLNGKSRKTMDVSNLSGLSTDVFVTPTAVYKIKSATSEKVRRSVRLQELNKTVAGHFPTDGKDDENEKDAVQTALTKDKNGSRIHSGLEVCPENSKVEFTNKRLSYKIVRRRESNTFKTKRNSFGRQPRVLTCQYRRRSLTKFRRRSNQFVSLAEAVSKFQNGTPQRFRTISQKDLKPGPLMKVKQAPLQLTYPVSPALRCKQRTRQTTVLSKEEREMRELEEMKKHQIKANPVPTNILKAPCALKKVPKKPTTVTEEFRLTQPKKTRHTTGPFLNQKDQPHKIPVSPTPSEKASNVIVKKDDNVKPTTRSVPFAFELRNKEFQMKKEQKIKNLQIQETAKTKAEFHARPVPNFSKTTAPAKEQSTKKPVVLCPFSFEQRDKCLAKKKEELLKQKQEENKKPHTFHANPVPVFKPVLVHGVSKENIKAKEKVPAKKPVVRQTKSCFDQENKQPNIISNTTICANSKKKETKSVLDDPNRKQITNTTEVLDCNDGKTKTTKKPIVKPKVPVVELNTDKRAKERNEFDEKIRKREQEEEAKRQEEEKTRLAREKMERAALRKLAEVKANPMPIYKPLIVLKSSKPPTSPQSPAWASRIKPKHVS